MKLIYPENKQEAEQYKLSKEKDMVAAIIGNDIDPNEFKELSVDASKGDSFIPPIKTNDDFLNKIIKMGIRLKDAPFAPYGKRLKALAINKSNGIEGTNMMNNIKRGILINHAMSPSRAIICADTWELDVAVIVRDRPGAANPMFEDGSMMVIYPNSEPFEIAQDLLINTDDMIHEAIVDTKHEEDNEDE